MVSTALQSSSTWQTNYSSSTFKEAVSYDANGNILTYKRHNHTGQTLDDLSYIYDNAGLTHKTNRLLAVNDAAAGSADFAEDVEGSNQYYYDQIGNITKINENGRSKDIAWNVYGKVRSVTMNTAQLTFGYDAQQNRFKKRVQKDGKTDINYYLRDAQGNTLAIYSKTERSEGTFFFWDEQHLYGSARLGIETTTLSMRGAVTNDPLSNEVLQAYAKYGNQWRDVLKARYYVVGRYIDQVFMDTWGESWEYRLNRLLDRGDEDYILQQTQNETYTITLGNKQYELSNHLGNVLAVVSDKKLFIDNTWQATVLSAQDYYPFGMSMPNRKWQNTEGGYRFGFNGQERDKEISEDTYTAEFWEYSANLGRRWNRDPIIKKYESPYACLGNNPVWYKDTDGADTVLYQRNNGYKLDKFTKCGGDGRNVMFTVDELSPNYDANNPWKTAEPLIYDVGSKVTDKNKKKGITGKTLPKDHPLAYNEQTQTGGTLAGMPVYEADLYDVTNIFDKVLEDGTAHFRPGWWGTSDWWFYNQVTDDGPYDIKSPKRSNTANVPIFAAIYIGEWTIWRGSLRRYDDYGNISYGYWGLIHGFSQEELLKKSDDNQDTKNGKTTTGKGDEPRDKYSIWIGIWLYNNNGVKQK